MGHEEHGSPELKYRLIPDHDMFNRSPTLFHARTSQFSNAGALLLPGQLPEARSSLTHRWAAGYSHNMGIPKPPCTKLVSNTDVTLSVPMMS